MIFRDPIPERVHVKIGKVHMPNGRCQRLGIYHSSGEPVARGESAAIGLEYRAKQNREYILVRAGEDGTFYLSPFLRQRN